MIEAKKEGATLTGVEIQSARYAQGLPATLPAWRRPLPFIYESTGVETHFTNGLDPQPRARNVFAFHRPETLLAWLGPAPSSETGESRGEPGHAVRDGATLTYATTFLSRVRSMPALITEWGDQKLWPAQITAIRNLVASLAEEAAVAAGRVFLKELDRLARSRESFAFESTLSGIGYAARLRKMKAAGYRIEIVYLKIASTRLALRRIAARVKQGGHNIARADVTIPPQLGELRRRVSADGGQVVGVRQFGQPCRTPGTWTMKAKASKPKHDEFSRAVARSLRRAAKEARKIARMYGTPVYVMKNGKVVAEKP